VDAMRMRVAQLKEQREKERKKVVEEKLLQKWRYIVQLSHFFIELNAMNCDGRLP
jgi:hypothetical protein